jgi:lipopolysaccharide export system permease protein
MLSLIIPVATGISVLYLYHKLIGDSEIIVLKSAGVSRIGLTIPALTMAAIAALLGYLISFYLLPASYREFKDTQGFIRNNYVSVLLQEGVFSTPVKGLTVYIDSRNRNGLLEGILVHDTRKAEESVTMMAKEGRLVQTDSGPRFELMEGNRQSYKTSSGNLSVLYFERFPLDLSIYTDAVTRSWRESEERYLHELLWPEEIATKQQRQEFISEAHHRITWPLYSFLLTLCGALMLLSGDFNRRNQWWRLLVAGGMILAALITHFMLKNIIIGYPSLTFMMYAVPILGSCACMLALHRPRGLT